jgi:abl interactor 2
MKEISFKNKSFLIANSYLKLFETQLQILNDSSNELTLINQEVNIHKEKVARREIGFITSNKTFVPGMKMKRSEMEEKPVKYIRKPIDYSQLDDVGHGVKMLNSDLMMRQNSYTSTTTNSQSSSSSSMLYTCDTMMQNHSLPNYDDFPTPPLALKSSGLASLNANSSGRDTIRSTTSNSSYYNRPSVAVILPPSVPSEYLSRAELGIYSSKKEINLNQSSCSDYLSSSSINQTTLDIRRASQTSAGFITSNTTNNNKFSNGNYNSSEYSSSYIL